MKGPRTSFSSKSPSSPPQPTRDGQRLLLSPDCVRAPLLLWFRTTATRPAALLAVAPALLAPALGGAGPARPLAMPPPPLPILASCGAVIRDIDLPTTTVTRLSCRRSCRDIGFGGNVHLLASARSFTLLLLLSAPSSHCCAAPTATATGWFLAGTLMIGEKVPFLNRFAKEGEEGGRLSSWSAAAAAVVRARVGATTSAVPGQAPQQLSCKCNGGRSATCTPGGRAVSAPVFAERMKCAVGDAEQSVGTEEGMSAAVLERPFGT